MASVISKDHAKQACEYLEDLCDRMDRGEVLTRGKWASLRFPALVPVALGLSLGCELYGAPPEGPPPYSAPWELCPYTKDDASDRQIDCDDPRCKYHPNCAPDRPLYAAPDGGSYGGGTHDARPPQEICDNGVDDNGDGLIDCKDPQCVDLWGCEVSLYAGPPEEICDNEIDDNGDDLIDCDDPQCEDFPGCMALPYAAPSK